MNPFFKTKLAPLLAALAGGARSYPNVTNDDCQVNAQGLMPYGAAAKAIFDKANGPADRPRATRYARRAD